MRTAEKVKPISTMQCPLTVMLLKNQPSKSGYANSSTFFTAARPSFSIHKSTELVWNCSVYNHDYFDPE